MSDTCQLKPKDSAHGRNDPPPTRSSTPESPDVPECADGVGPASFVDPNGVRRRDYTGDLAAGRYRIRKRLGVGGMGVVYLGHHVTIDRPVALKILHAELEAKSGYADRFLQEARTASRIRHPNVVDITDFGTLEDGMPFFVMPYLSGVDLSALIGDGRSLSCTDARAIAVQILDALACAHDAGVIHRDMKPENCFCERDGSGEWRVTLLDFGIAKVVGDSGPCHPTGAGQVLGTPQYMSPEQAKARPLDLRSDLYSVGVMLFEMLTGQNLFEADGMHDLLDKQVNEPPRAPSEVLGHGSIPPGVDQVVLRALEKDPAKRYSDARQFREAVERWTDHDVGAGHSTNRNHDQGPRRRYRALAVGGASILAVAAALAAWPSVNKGDPPVDGASAPASPGGPGPRLEPSVHAQAPDPGASARTDDPALPDAAPPATMAATGVQPTPDPQAPEPEPTSKPVGTRSKAKRPRAPDRRAKRDVSMPEPPLSRGRAVVREHVLQHTQPDRKRCSELVSPSERGARLRVKITIRPDGSPRDVSVVGSAFKESDAARCLIEAIGKVKFGPARAEEKTTVALLLD